MTTEQAERAVEAIIEDLCDRKGLEEAWESIDGEIQREIRSAWVDFVISASEDVTE